MQVKIKKLHQNAVIPKYANNTDAGLDLVAISKNLNSEYDYLEYGTGLAIAIPEGHVGLIFPRSSISNTCLSLANAVGVIDSGYRGEIKLRFILNSCPEENTMDDIVAYKVGDKVAQLVIIPYPQIEFEEVEELTETERSTGGFGSTGK